jgi:hypothetical protein
MLPGPEAVPGLLLPGAILVPGGYGVPGTSEGTNGTSVGINVRLNRGVIKGIGVYMILF